MTPQQHMTPTETATLLATFLRPRATDYERSTFDPSRVYKLLQACRPDTKGHLIDFRQEFFQCQSLEAKFVSDVLRLSAELTIYNASCGKNCGKNRSKAQEIIGSPSKIPATIPRVPLARISTSPKKTNHADDLCLREIPSDASLHEATTTLGQSRGT